MKKKIFLIMIIGINLLAENSINLENEKNDENNTVFFNNQNIKKNNENSLNFYNEEENNKTVENNKNLVEINKIYEEDSKRLISLYESFIKKDKNNPYNYFRLNQIYFKQNNYKKSIEYGEKSKKIYKNLKIVNKESIENDFYLANSYYEMKDYEKSFNIFFDMYSNIVEFGNEEEIQKFIQIVKEKNRQIENNEIIYAKNNLKMEELEWDKIEVNNEIEEKAFENSENITKLEIVNVGKEKSDEKTENEERSHPLYYYSEILPSPIQSAPIKKSTSVQRHNSVGIKLSAVDVKISSERVKDIIISNAKVNKKNIKITKLMLERENKKYVYNIIFFTDVKRFDYKIDANSGSILKKNEKMRNNSTTNRKFFGIF